MADADPTPVVYHGTNPDAAAAILRDGFVDIEVVDAFDRPVSGVFVTSSVEVAGGYGEVVLAIEIDPATASTIADDIDRWDETMIPADILNHGAIRVVES
jgi:hypothetical protein